MTFIVQTDTVTTNANAYISVAFFKSYHDARGRDYSTYSDANIQTAIVRATDYLDERFQFVGERLQIDQTTEWPRLNCFDIDDNYIDEVPREVKEATAEYAFIALGVADLSPSPTRDDTGRPVQSFEQSVGPISEAKTFANGAPFELPKYPKADRKLINRGFVVSRGMLYRG